MNVVADATLKCCSVNSPVVQFLWLSGGMDTLIMTDHQILHKRSNLAVVDFVWELHKGVDARFKSSPQLTL